MSLGVTLPQDSLPASSKAQLLLLTLDEGYLLTTAVPDLQRGIAPLGPPVPVQPLLLGLLLPVIGPGLRHGWKILKEMGIPDHLTCLLRNLYAGQEATVRTGHGTTD